MKDQSKIDQQQKISQEKSSESEPISEHTRSFVSPQGIMPVPVQLKPNLIQKMQSLQKHAKSGYFQPNLIQRMQNLPEEQRSEKLQPNTIQKIQRKKSDEEEQASQLKSESGKKMPEEVQSKMEHSMGTDFSDVTIHEGDNASSVGALAYTQGNNIHFAPGMYEPENEKGQKLLGHELAHVVQQREGKVKATTQAKGLPVNDDEQLEKEADEMGDKAAQFKKDNGTPPPSEKATSNGNVIQKVNETPASYKTNAQMILMSCFELDEYANAQADWHASPTLTDANRDQYRKVLEFLRTGSNLAPCGEMKVASIIDHMNIRGEAYVKKNLGGYCEAVANSDPFEYTSTTDPVKASSFGAVALKLKTTFPAYVLSGSFKEGIVNKLNANSWIDDLILYYTTSKPTPLFQGQEGADLVAYYNMRKFDASNPLSYNTAPLQGKIRNFHRFEKDALNALKVNFNDLSKTKPLTLILHTALDHNGAFHRDPELTKVIKNPKINTLMIEGKETLDEVKADITPLAKKYGKNDKLDQVMFAGHGNERSIELAGSIKDDGSGKIKEVGDGIDLDSNAAKSNELFDEVLKNIDDASTTPADKQVHRKILFNACLTNSNQVDSSSAKGLTKTEDIKKAFLANLKTSGSLTTYLQDRANTQGKDTKVKGSNASFGSIGLINSTTADLDLVSPWDPKLTAPKLEYMEFGTEALGTLRAAVECWATDEKTCFEAMERRIKKKNADWDELIITKSYEIILAKYKTDGIAINRFTRYADILSEGKHEAHCKPSYFARLDNWAVDVLDLFKALSGSTQFTSQKFIPLVLYQNWMTLDPSDASMKTKFLDYLKTNYNCRSAQKFVDIDYLDKKGHFKDLLSGTASTGKLMLALLGVVKTNQTDCKAYVISQLTATDTFDAALKVNTLLGGLSTENDVLIKIGKKTAPTSSSSSSSSSSATQNANVVPLGETKNKVYVDSVTKKGKISTTPEALTFTLPEISSKQLDKIAKDTEVNILGSADTFWAIEYKTKDAKPKRGTAFVRKADIAVS